jgi:branched-chain amino acid transport system ATP-binding protein
MSALSLQRLSKSFGGVRALDDVSFDIAAGECVAMIGPNGAGKSTCFNVVNGQLAPDSGRVLLQGRDITGLNARAISMLGVGRTFQVAALFGSMSVRQNVQAARVAHRRETLRFWASAEAVHCARAGELLDLVGLAQAAERPCRELAHGDRKRLELALALAGDPRVLLMDEPAAGMAARERHALGALVKRLAGDRGIAVLLTEHAMDVVFAFADRIVVLAQGRVIANGSVEAVREDANVRAVYFGGGSTFAAASP